MGRCGTRMRAVQLLVSYSFSSRFFGIGIVDSTRVHDFRVVSFSFQILWAMFLLLTISLSGICLLFSHVIRGVMREHFSKELSVIWHSRGDMVYSACTLYVTGHITVVFQEGKDDMVHSGCAFLMSWYIPMYSFRAGI
jgi:hypothetical protein